MDVNIIEQTLSKYISDKELAGCSLLVRRGNEILYSNKWGYSNIEEGTPIEDDSIFRQMSMTKCITAVAVMMCVEQGLLSLDDPLSKYLGEFKNMKVVNDKRYEFTPEKMKKLPFMLLTFSLKKVKRCDAVREVTIRDLLSHSSGIQQGLVGMLTWIKDRQQFTSLREFVMNYSNYLLDFQPGTGTGYSPIAGFDILAYLVSYVSGMPFEEYVQKNICKPLGMTDTTFFLNEEQKGRLVSLYKHKKGRLVNVTGTKDDMAGVIRQNEILFEHGCGGIYSTLYDYDRFGHMLLNGGELDGVTILKQETVRLMHTEAPEEHLEPDPGWVWGLGMKIRQDPQKAKINSSAGTYGWSGAFGTHFFVSPEDNLEVVFMSNRSDAGGSGFYVSQKVEELVFDIWGQKKADE